MAVFLALFVPGIVWAVLRTLLPPKRKSVAGQVVLITGAARGLGREVALVFSKLGAKIACVDIDEISNQETAQIIKDAGGIAYSYKCDISNKDQIKVLHAQIKEDMGPVEILINNAAIVWGHMFIDPNQDQFIIDQINVNLMGQIWMNREILPSMMERNRGHIVAISSLSSVAGQPGISIYTTSKWATNGMMECIYNELKEFNSAVKTTTVLPYFVKTNPKVTERLDISLPEIPVKYASEIIVEGILEEKRIFSVPNYLLQAMLYIRLLPDNLRTLAENIFPVIFTKDAVAQELMQKYKQF